MNKSKISILAFLFPMAALGADLPAATQQASAPSMVFASPVSSWGGFYAGVNGGYGASEHKNGIQSPVAFNFQRSGFLGGLQAGYALQSGPIVYGVEADYQLASLTGDARRSFRWPLGDEIYADTFAKWDSKISALATVRGRLGYAFDHVLIYGTGGFAKVRSATSVAMTAVVGERTIIDAYTLKQWSNGWTLGVGSEYRLSDNVSIKLEYLFTRFKYQYFEYSSAHRTLQLVRTGVNYRF